MQGRVKMFNTDKGFGFIIGEDGNDYFAHISNVISIQDLHIGVFVSFEPNENDKGKYATKIVAIENKKPTFVVLGDTRVKISNIKNYGIAAGTRYYAKVYQRAQKTSKGIIDRFFESEWKWLGLNVEISKSIYSKCGEGNWKYRYIKYSNGEIDHYRSTKDCGPGYISKSDLSTKNVKYLYVTTYQNDNYEFWEDEVDFDINDKCNEIDNCML